MAQGTLKKKTTIGESAVLPEEKLLLDAFYRAKEATTTPPGVTVDIQAVASNAIRAYWKAKDKASVDSESLEPLSPMDLPLFRYDVVKSVWSIIDPLWEFSREVLSSTLPTLGGVALLGIGYIVISRKVSQPPTNAPYLLSVALGTSAVVLTIFFLIRRQAFLGSRWRVLQSSAGSLVGGLLVGAFATVLGILLLNQKSQVVQYARTIDTYQDQVQLDTTVDVVQPIAASVLSTKPTSNERLAELIYTRLRESELAQGAQIKRIPTKTDRDITYQIEYPTGLAKSSTPLNVTFGTQKIDVERQGEPGYVIWESSIQDITSDSVTLSPISQQSSLTVPISQLSQPWEQANLKDLKGKRVMVTYDLVLNKPVNITLLDKPYVGNLFSTESLGTRIRLLNSTQVSAVNTRSQ